MMFQGEFIALGTEIHRRRHWRFGAPVLQVKPDPDQKHSGTLPFRPRLQRTRCGQGVYWSIQSSIIDWFCNFVGNIVYLFSRRFKISPTNPPKWRISWRRTLICSCPFCYPTTATRPRRFAVCHPRWRNLWRFSWNKVRFNSIFCINFVWKISFIRFVSFNYSTDGQWSLDGPF